MVDCRNCENAHRIWNDGCIASEEKYELVCLARKIFIDREWITYGPCDDYVDMDGYDTTD